MCGIAGFMGQVENRADVIRNMTEVITHRGPDSDGFFTDDNISMGFRRLSIIDLGAGHQPIYNEDKSLVLTFNGEIYNYKDLRKELIAKGHKFYTDTDSEVLVHGFEEWKEDMLPKLRGMFGFAIYNTKDNSLFIARDFFGIKPMHYTQIGNDFVYASEIKSILEYPKFEKKFNRKALDSYLSFQYAVPPETFFEGVYCLMPGHYLWYKDGEVETTRYFEARFNPDEEMTEEEAVDRIEKVFENSVNAHKIADVEVGCFLSSGVDSSYVSTYFADQKTFTVGFDFGEKYNEISWAKNLSEKIGVEHHTHLISSEEFWDAVPTVQYHMDQPLADPSCIALYFVSRLASHYVKVVLSGEGADELFGGYTCYNDPRVFKIYQTIVPHCIRKAIRAICRKLPDIKGRDYLIRACDKLEERYIGNAFMYDYKQKQELLKDPSIATRPQDLTRKYYYRCRKYDDVTKMQYLDINMWMVGDILLKADRMSMANSLELRVPFLDKEVFKVASSLPTKLRCNKHNTKYAMRKAAVRHMPEATAEKEKLGFPVPTRVWLRDEKYYNVVKTKFKGKTAEKFFNTDVLVSWLDSHFSGKEDNSRRVWTIYVFLVWYDIYFDEDSEKVEKPVNHLDELKAVAEARREKQIDAPGEVIMAAAEEIDENYDAPNFGVDKSKKNDESAEKAEESVKEESAEEVTEEVEVPDDGNEPAIVEPEEEPEVKEEPKKEEYVNISNPEDNEIYDAPKKPSTPQEQMQMAIDSIEKRSKYLDEPNVISDEAVDNIVNSISFFDDEDDKN
jgi:asparagine synthase (glutamine-hydrolysing)